MKAMRPLWLDYRRPLPGRQRPGLLLLLTALLLCGVVLEELFSIDAELASTERQVARLRREAERRTDAARTDSPATTAAQSERRAASPSAARWESLLHSLESAADDSVTLLALDPGPQTIAIGGEARDLGAALDYVNRLQATPIFADVHLARHEVVSENPHRPVRFTLQANWREAAR